ncbi:hypothetical protein FQR65_LT15982 [Abscondita terminalis]|nr:hypothetical protein FQR65_LT15982 [Abscondita terminalis]
MYALVVFKEDHVHYVCHSKYIGELLPDGSVWVLWKDGVRYPANVLTQNRSKLCLQQLCDDIENNLFQVRLDKSLKLTNSPVSNGTDINKEYDFNLIENSTIEPSDVIDSSLLLETSTDNFQEDFKMDSSNQICIQTPSFISQKNLPSSSDVADTLTFTSLENLKIDSSDQIENKVDQNFICKPTSLSPEHLFHSNDSVADPSFKPNVDSSCDSTNDNFNKSFASPEHLFDSDDSVADPSYIPEIDMTCDTSHRNINELSPGKVKIISNVLLPTNKDDIILKNLPPVLKSFDRTTVNLPLDQPRLLQDIAIPDVEVELAGRRSSRSYFCIYCKKLTSNLPQHLRSRHDQEMAVRQFLNLPPGDSERRKIIETIRRKGDYIHNTYQEHNTGRLLIARRSSTSTCLRSDITTCPECKGQFHKHSLRKHFKRCSSQAQRFRVIILANHLCRLYPDAHFDDMIRAKLRLLGRLLIQAKKLDSSIKGLSSLIDPTRYDLVLAAVNKVAGLNEDGTHYKSPATATTSNTLLKLASNIWRTECIKLKRYTEKQDAEDFLFLMKNDNATAVNRVATENRVQHQRLTKLKLPSKEDIHKLVSYVKCIRRQMYSKLKNLTGEDVFPYEVWHSLSSATLISLLVFNRRRPGELERITIADYCSRNKTCRSTLSETDSQLFNLYSRFEIRGKLNRSVPVLVHWEAEHSINLILKLRNAAGVDENNPYVFGLPTLDYRQRYLRACVIMRMYSEKCGASQPQLLRATILRKQVATECAIKELTENTIKDVAMFMGHAENIHNNIYRQPVHERDIIKMSRILEEAQGDHNVSDEEDDTNNLDELENLYMQASTSDTVENRTDIPDAGLKYHAPGLKRFSGPKKPWSTDEINAATELFGDCLAEEVLPCYDRLASACQSEQLKSRSPQGIKLWIQNQITRKRKSSASSQQHDLSSPNSSSVKRPRWDYKMKQALLDAFATCFEDQTLPSKAEINVAYEKYPILKNKNYAAIKTAVLNERNRRERGIWLHIIYLTIILVLTF